MVPTPSPSCLACSAALGLCRARSDMYKAITIPAPTITPVHKIDVTKSCLTVIKELRARDCPSRDEEQRRSKNDALEAANRPSAVERIRPHANRHDTTASLDLQTRGDSRTSRRVV